MSRRLRVAHVVVTPVLVWDDGEELAPGPAVQSLTVPLSQLAALAESLPGDLAQIEAQAEQDQPT